MSCLFHSTGTLINYPETGKRRKQGRRSKRGKRRRVDLCIGDIKTGGCTKSPPTSLSSKRGAVREPEHVLRRPHSSDVEPHPTSSQRAPSKPCHENRIDPTALPSPRTGPYRSYPPTVPSSSRNFSSPTSNHRSPKLPGLGSCFVREDWRRGDLS